MEKASKKIAVKKKKKRVLKIIESSGPPSIVVDGAASMLALVGQMATNPDIDMDKVERLMALQVQMQERDNEAAFNQVLSEVQGGIGVIVKNKENTQTSSNYADLGAIVEVITPVYTSAGMSLSFDSKPAVDGIVPVICYVSACGHTRTYTYESPITDKGIKGTVMMTPAHARGSAVSYGRRYLTCMIFNIATADDDGNGAGGNAAGGPDPELITEEQVLQIHSRASEFEVLDGLLGWLKKTLKCDRLEDVHVTSFDIVSQRLESAIRAKGEG